MSTNRITRRVFQRSVKLLFALVLVASILLSQAQVIAARSDEQSSQDDVNIAPVLYVDNYSIAVAEGQLASNGGTVSDQDGDAFSLSATVGVVHDNNDGTWTWNYTPDDGPAGSQIVIITAEDSNGGTASASFDLTANNVAPTAIFENDGPVDEGASFTLSLADPFDPSSADTHAGFEYAFDCGDGDGFGSFSASSRATCPTRDDGIRSVSARIRDKDGGFSEYIDNVTIHNVAPEIGVIAAPLIPVRVNDIIDFTIVFTDPGVLDSQDLFLDWGDGTSIRATIFFTDPSFELVTQHTYADPGIYTTQLTVSDDDGGETTRTSEPIVIYDPDGGYVAGNGWFWSPEGAYNDDPGLEGYALFAFVSRYKRGANMPTGVTKFLFSVGDLDFRSSSYEWLVVTGSNYARFKGSGTINDELAPNGEAYKFQIWARDDAPDTFRIRIWYEVDGVEIVVYDNSMQQEIEGGDIAVHDQK